MDLASGCFCLLVLLCVSSLPLCLSPFEFFFSAGVCLSPSGVWAVTNSPSSSLFVPVWSPFSERVSLVKSRFFLVAGLSKFVVWLSGPGPLI
jgi:hypothetical protein